MEIGKMTVFGKLCPTKSEPYKTAFERSPPHEIAFTTRQNFFICIHKVTASTFYPPQTLFSMLPFLYPSNPANNAMVEFAEVNGCIDEISSR
jgi:hypothetical protein